MKSETRGGNRGGGAASAWSQFQLAQRAPKERPTDSWWVGLSRDDFRAVAGKRAEELRIQETSTAHFREPIGSKTPKPSYHDEGEAA